jgi:hypothetical protein
MCDAIRGSQFVALLLPDEQPHRKLDWGRRMWTLPEGLLAPGKLQVCTWLGLSKYSIKLMGKVELASQYWSEEYEGGGEVPGRILAEHYEGITTLSRLELFSTAVSALGNRVTANDFTGADLAYALMGLLHYRIDPDPTDDLFQVIARLSLANDNDRLIERLVSMFPRSLDNKEEFFRSFAEIDQYETHSWDIEPRCQVVGVGDEPSTVILSECRAVPIRWKRFPRMMYKRHLGLKKGIAELVIRSGAWWMITGYGLAFTYAPIFLIFAELADYTADLANYIAKIADYFRITNPLFSGTQHHYQRWLWAAILLFICTGLLLSIFAPRAVRRLFGGAVLQSAPHLVAFEGIMPRADLERMVFGSDGGRLRYEPSSTPFARDFRHPYIRKGIEPEWIAKSQYKEPLPGNRWFTLVDTGNLSISVFQAKRPPTVAFITGAEGGMLRAVLCSWRFVNDCHYRETVIRVPSNTWDLCKPAAWVKVSFQSQDDLFAVSNRPRTWAPTRSPPPPPAHASSSSPPPPPKPTGPLWTAMEKAHAVKGSVQNRNPAERIRGAAGVVGGAVQNRAKQTKQRLPKGSKTSSQPELHRKMSSPPATSDIGSAQTPYPTSPQPSHHSQTQFPQPSYHSQKQPYNPATISLPARTQAQTERPLLVSRYTPYASNPVPEVPYFSAGDYGFTPQPLGLSHMRPTSLGSLHERPEYGVLRYA